MGSSRRAQAGDAAAAKLGHPGVGLRSHEAIANVVEAVGHLPAPKPGTDLNAYVVDLARPIQAELARARVPAPRVQAGPLPEHLGAMYDPATHTITISESVVEGTPVNDMTTLEGRQEILSLLFHEARHAEQTVLALRYIARDNPARLAGLQDRVDPLLLRVASAEPLPPGDSAEAQLGHRAYEELFGEGEAHERYMRGQSHETWQGLQREIVMLRAVRAAFSREIADLGYSFSAPERAQARNLQREILVLEVRMKEMEATYTHLFVEVDARGAQADLAHEMGNLNARRAELERQLDSVILALQSEVQSGGEPEARAAARVQAQAEAYRDGLERIPTVVPGKDDPDRGGEGGKR
jgi:hypothetical protein